MKALTHICLNQVSASLNLVHLHGELVLHADYVKCVLLNACYSEKPAVAISQYIDYVIGMNNPIQDRAAIEFARGFYDGLGYRKSGNQDVFQRAFDEGMVAIEMENFSQGAIPVLKKR